MLLPIVSIMDKISSCVLRSGGYLDGYQYLLKILESKESTTVIITGITGIGKMTLVREVVKEVEAMAIYLDTFDHPDDHSAIKMIASKLGIKASSSLPEIMESLENYAETYDGKIVIVLQDIEEFCRQKQSLLYCLTDLTQHSKNICLVGLTMAMDSTEFLEKRVRSRLNAQFYNLKPPYRNKEEYVRFASQLLQNHKITGNLKDHLEFMYETGNLSIRTLKRFLLTICSFYDGKLTVDQPVDPPTNPRDDFGDFCQRLTWLTKKQLELLKSAVSYCVANETNEFTLGRLQNYVQIINCRTLDFFSPQATKNTALLACIAMFIKSKPNDVINQYTLFTLGISPSVFKTAIQRNWKLQDIGTDKLWKDLP